MAQEDFVRSTITIDGIVMFMAQDFNRAISNGAQQKSTLRANPAGTQIGKRSCSGGFKMFVPDDPNAQDPIDEADVIYKIPHIIEVKEPGGKRELLDVVFTEHTLTTSVEGGTEVDLKFIGWPLNFN